ncbi:PRTRC system ThiF family protein [Pseudomonas aeruginosa]|uniref:PRTRC system ThiF family protein n=1 Tax=Pseudomonas aeruginosa TaxID=287 RepID=UPI0011548A2A|nr:PRTRC system ThiF family protein [Pseudomonas aeruginosa]TQG59490.1 PRTRC system ThiF family protein [Pseudomonas aeruginosa]TQG67229.1 PRTRC system ThiF family protein [Pseudomonas aeruginosa]
MGAVQNLIPETISFKTPDSWLSSAPRIVVIGAGGNGSEVVDCLAQFHHAMISLGHKHGLHVTIIDDSVVREPNLVRQRFWPCDLGQYKAISLANRYNLLLGMKWEGLPYRFPSRETDDAIRNADLIISAVDLPSARVAIGACEAVKHNCMWLDLGNGHRHGQVVFGGINKVMRDRFPNVLDAYPEIPSLKDDHTKSCSAAESIRSQDCLVNRAVTTAGMGIVWELLRNGETSKHWLVLNLGTGEQMSYPFPPPAPKQPKATGKKGKVSKLRKV